MKKLALLALLSVFLALPLHAQTVSSSGSFQMVVFGFSPLGSGSSTCQPAPAPAPACALPNPSLGVAYSVTLSTVGPTTSVTCTVSSGSLPSWMTLTSSGTSCKLSGTPTSAGAIPAFTISFSGS